MDEKLINLAKDIQKIAEEQAEKLGKSYIGALPHCEIMVTVLVSPRGGRQVYYYLNGQRSHKKRITKLIVKLLAIQAKKNLFNTNH